MRRITLILSKIKYVQIGLIIITLSSYINWIASAKNSPLNIKQQIRKEKVGLYSEWQGLNTVPKNIAILVLAGHADSQGIAGAGTAGEAVDVNNSPPMSSSMSDELFWNLKVQKAIVRIGQEQGLNIKSYDPKIRNIHDGNNPQTNWSVGAKHIKEGGYAFEIHFDSYGEYGFGSGIIPAISTKLNNIDESLAKSFGRYPMFFRGGLGAPRRGIRILEIAKLEGELEKNLRNINSREHTINKIAKEIVFCLSSGLNLRN